MSNPASGDFDYAIGTVYTGGALEGGLSIETIPAQTWAIFPCVGAMPTAFDNLWKKIYTEVFPTNEYQPSGGPPFKVYPNDDILSEDYTCEIWIAVEKS